MWGSMDWRTLNSQSREKALSRLHLTVHHDKEADSSNNRNERPISKKGLTLLEEIRPSLLERDRSSES